MRMGVFPAALIAMILASCGGKEESVQPATDAAPEPGVFDAQINALDDAKEVDELNRRKKAAVDDALRQAEGDPC